VLRISIFVAYLRFEIGKIRIAYFSLGYSRTPTRAFKWLSNYYQFQNSAKRAFFESGNGNLAAKQPWKELLLKRPRL